MGTLQSPHKEIEGLRIEPWPSKPAAVRAVRVDRVIVGVNSIGTVYSTCLNQRAYYTFANWNGSEDLLLGLRKLGVISKEIMDDHVRRAEEHDAKNASLHNAESVARDAKEEGIILPRDVQEQLVARVRRHWNPYKINESLKNLAKHGIDADLLKPVPIPKH